MEKCPQCGNLSVAYDAYFGIMRCYTNLCDYADRKSIDDKSKKEESIRAAYIGSLGQPQYLCK